MTEFIEDIVEKTKPKLVEFYSIGEDGFLTKKPQVIFADNVDAALAHGSSEEVVTKFLVDANDGRNWKYYDDYTKWMNEEPKETDTCFLVPLDEEGNPRYPSFFSETHDAWLANEPSDPVVKNLADYANYPNWLKLQGVMFDGVKCSATKEDMWGLGSAESLIRSGTDVLWHFDNGNNLLLTSSNIDAFYSVWVPFRLGFFPVPNQADQGI